MTASTTTGATTVNGDTDPDPDPIPNPNPNPTEVLTYVHARGCCDISGQWDSEPQGSLFEDCWEKTLRLRLAFPQTLATDP